MFELKGIIGAASIVIVFVSTIGSTLLLIWVAAAVKTGATFIFLAAVRSASSADRSITSATACSTNGLLATTVSVGTLPFSRLKACTV